MPRGVGVGPVAAGGRGVWPRSCPARADRPSGGPPQPWRLPSIWGTPPPEPSSAPTAPSRASKLPNILGAPCRAANTPTEPSENVRVVGADRDEHPVRSEPGSSSRSSPGRPGEDSSGRVQRVGALARRSMRVGPSRPRRLNRPGRRHTPNQRPIRSTTSWASVVPARSGPRRAREVVPQIRRPDSRCPGAQ